MLHVNLNENGRAIINNLDLDVIDSVRMYRSFTETTTVQFNAALQSAKDIIGI